MRTPLSLRSCHCLPFFLKPFIRPYFYFLGHPLRWDYVIFKAKGWRLSGTRVPRRRASRPGAGGSGDRQARGSRQRLRRLAETLGGEPPYNVASLGFEWSSFIERQGGRRPLIVSGIERRASRFVAGESESPQVLMRHRRPAPGPTADGGAHGPIQGSPSAASARIIRSDKIERPAPDRCLRLSRPDRSAHSPAVESRPRPRLPIENSESGR